MARVEIADRKARSRGAAKKCLGSKWLVVAPKMKSKLRMDCATSIERELCGVALQRLVCAMARVRSDIIFFFVF